MQHTVITIGREYGSGGRLIAQRAAEELGIPFYDRKLIQMAARETGFSEEFIRNTEERKVSSFLYDLYFSRQNLPLADQVYIAESKIIQHVASEGSCVIVGRCADYVLCGHPGRISIFIHAPLGDRVARAKNVYGVDVEDVQSYVQKQDKSRAAYYNHFTDANWGQCQNYDFSVNSALGADLVVRLIADLARNRGINA